MKRKVTKMNYQLQALTNETRLLETRIILAETMLSNMECFETDVYHVKTNPENGEILVDEDGKYLRDYEKVNYWFMDKFPMGFSEDLVADMGKELMGVVTNAVIAWAEGRKIASK